MTRRKTSCKKGGMNSQLPQANLVNQNDNYAYPIHILPVPVLEEENRIGNGVDSTYRHVPLYDGTTAFINMYFPGQWITIITLMVFYILVYLMNAEHD